MPRCQFVLEDVLEVRSGKGLHIEHILRDVINHVDSVFGLGPQPEFGAVLVKRIGPIDVGLLGFDNDDCSVHKTHG